MKLLIEPVDLKVRRDGGNEAQKYISCSVQGRKLFLFNSPYWTQQHVQAISFRSAAGSLRLCD
jgi:hypothetical protein